MTQNKTDNKVKTNINKNLNQKTSATGAKPNAHEAQLEKRSRENMRISVIVCLGVLEILGVYLLFSYMGPSALLPTITALKVAALVLGAAFLVCALHFALNRKKEQYNSIVFRSFDFAIAFLLLTIITAACALYPFLAVKALLVLIPAYIFCYIAMVKFERNFFLITMLSFKTLFIVFIYPKASEALLFYIGRIGAVLMVAVAVCLLVLIFGFLKKNAGQITLSGRKISLFPPNTNYVPLAIMACAVILSFASIFVFGNDASMYIMYALVGIYVLQALYALIKYSTR